MTMQSHSEPYGRIDKRKSFRARWFLVSGALVAIVISIFVVHDVPADPTAADRISARLILASAGYGDSGILAQNLSTFENQVSAILAVQDAVFAVARSTSGIPFDTAREPADLLAYKEGACFDRSRVIEKILASMGMETRHIAVYSTAKTGSALVSLLSPSVGSHAISEVKTVNGWMVIDSNVRWIGLTDDDVAISIKDLQSLDPATVRWSSRNRDQMSGILGMPFTYLIGLYSRHGRFFPPYSPVPDYNIHQLLTGLFS